MMCAWRFQTSQIPNRGGECGELFRHRRQFGARPPTKAQQEHESHLFIHISDESMSFQRVGKRAREVALTRKPCEELSSHNFVSCAARSTTGICNQGNKRSSPSTGKHVKSKQRGWR